MSANKSCFVCGEKFSSHFDGIPYCNKHYQKARAYGDPLKSKTSKNSYTIDRETAVLLTTKGERFIVDLENLENVLRYTWCVSKTGYIVANTGKKVIKLHRYLISPPEDMVVDHINGDKFDNRISNLRVCTQSDNSKNAGRSINNKTGYPGIRITPSGKYNVRITVNRKGIHVGNFDTLEEAIEKRIEAEIQHFKEFSPSLGALSPITECEEHEEAYDE